MFNLYTPPVQYTRPEPLPPVPIESIQKLFKRLELEYGSKFKTIYGEADPEDVLHFWAKELACFVDKPASIAHGIANLPDGFPPTVREFKAICLRAPSRELRLEAPLANPAIVKAALEAIGPSSATAPKAWAERLRQREQNGERLSRGQREAWRNTLKHPKGDPA